MKNFGLIGVGNMGYAMLKGAVSTFASDQIVYTDISRKRLEMVKVKIGLNFCLTNVEVVKKAKYIVLAIKPQYIGQVLEEIKDELTTDHIIISVSPGLTIDSFKQQIGNEMRVVRAMPNTPALVGEGMSVICFSIDTFLDCEKKDVINFFESFGDVLELKEALMDAVVPVSGSSPAYVYMFIEAMADAGVRLGLLRADAYHLAAKTVLGAACMVLDTGEHPAVLKDQVCSPGGTTIEAVAELEKNGFRSAVMEAMQACYDKSKTIGKR